MASTAVRLASFTAVVLLAACGFKAPAPQRTAPPPTPQLPLSTLTASLTIPASDIAKLLNEKTAAHLTEMEDRPVKCAIGRCKLDLVATRTGPITAGQRDNKLALGVPFAIDAEMKLPGFLSMVRARANGEGEATAVTTATLTPDWQLRTHTSGDVQLDNAHLRVGPVVTNLADVLNENEDILSRPLFSMLDKAIDSGVKLRPRIEKVWARAFTPIRVGKKPLAWLLLAPERLRVAQPYVEEDAVFVSIGLDVRARVVTQDLPPAAKPTPLPPPAPLEHAGDRFSFAVPLFLPYDEAARLALASLKKKPPHIAGMSIDVSDLRILPSGSDVIVAASFCARQGWDSFDWFSSCGNGYLRGTPIYDAATESIRVKNLHYDIATASVILTAVRALAGDQFAAELQKRLVFKVAKDLDKLERQVKETLAKPQGRDVTIFGDVQSFGTPTLAWTADGFLATFTAQGTVHADLHV